jgi:hypothetical protein
MLTGIQLLPVERTVWHCREMADEWWGLMLCSTVVIVYWKHYICAVFPLSGMNDCSRTSHLIIAVHAQPELEFSTTSYRVQTTGT